MKEENEDLMSLFSSENLELNFDFAHEDVEDPIDEEDQDENKDKDTQKNKDITEQDDAEDVGDDEEDDNESEEDDSNDESSPNLYSSIVNVLKEQGIIPSLESSTEIKSAEDLINVLKSEVDVQAQKKFDEYIDNLDVSKVAESKKSQIALADINEETLKSNLELAKEVIFRDYLNQGLSEEKASKMLKRTIDGGEELLLEDAIESLTSLKVFQAKQIEVEKLEVQKRMKLQQEEQQKQDLEVRNKIYNSKEIIKGFPLTKALQDNIYRSMTDIVGKNPESGILENKLMQDRAKDPIGFDVKMYSLYVLTNGFTDFKKVITNTKSKALSDFERVLKQQKIEDNGVPTYLQDKESYDGIGSEIVY